MNIQMLRCDYDYMRTALLYHDVKHTVNPYRHQLNFNMVTVSVAEEFIARFNSIRKRLKIG